MTKWSDIISWGVREKPALPDNKRIQCLYINGKGEIMNEIATGNGERTIGGHTWNSEFPKAITLAYRYEIKQVQESQCYWDTETDFGLLRGMVPIGREAIPLKAVWDKSKEPGDPEEFTLRRAK